ncbi:hypothetical protein BV25DRAFT_1842723 [Artomyces pyxidatus]|uniref:Uncharacterized protein n=1 Tax=Artomyces pyxidatus TaxID=48021 RepID=A0ACB8SHA3_9AGAM|nr:hypothetical protein BV25DRAFT_1842723 [Artomyces pyxidatus]
MARVAENTTEFEQSIATWRGNVVGAFELECWIAYGALHGTSLSICTTRPVASRIAGTRSFTAISLSLSEVSIVTAIKRSALPHHPASSSRLQMSQSFIVDETEEDRHFPPELVDILNKPWRSSSKDSDSSEVDNDGNEGAGSLFSSMDILSLSTNASADGMSPDRIANASLPRQIDDEYYVVFVGRKLGVMSHR